MTYAIAYITIKMQRGVRKAKQRGANLTHQNSAKRDMEMNKNTGIIITLVAGVFWGFSGACSQYIFDNFHTDPTYLTSIRLLCGGLILVAIGFFREKEKMIGIWRERSSALLLLLFSLIGIMFCQLTYMKTISYTNSGTATILQYLGPALIMIVSCFLAKRLPRPREAFAVIMAILGIFFIATHGNIENMVINPLGLSWGLWSAVALAVYTMLPQPIVAKYGSIVVIGYGMLIGGGILSLACRIWTTPADFQPRFLLAFTAVVIFGTVLPFTIYMIGVRLCGAVKASMLASIEPVSATVFMVVWLKEDFHIFDFIGFSFILVTIFLLAKKVEPEPDKDESPTCGEEPDSSV